MEQRNVERERERERERDNAVKSGTMGHTWECGARWRRRTGISTMVVCEDSKGIAIEG